MLVTIAGNIGSGKSSLTMLLSQKFGWTPYFESVDDNPYLADFYADMRRWAFHLQVYFLSKRFIVQRAIAESDADVVQDRSIYEDAEIFARNLNSIGMMDDRDYSNYRALFDAMTGYLQTPDLLVYLRASVDTLRRQIAARGRPFEQSISDSYLEQLNVLYEEWISSYKEGKLLVVDADNSDFVHNMQQQEKLLYEIRRAVRPRRR